MKQKIVYFVIPTTAPFVFKRINAVPVPINTI